MEAPTCAVVANGDLRPEDLNLIEPNSMMVVACDGAVWPCLRHGMTPNAVVGDLDSIEEEGGRKALPSDMQVMHIPDQTENDLAKAMAWAKAQGHRALLVVGATGGDLQHEWANMLACAAISADVTVIDRRGTRRFLTAGTQYHLQVGDRAAFSLMAVHDVEGLTLDGAKFELNNATLRTGSRGVHNVALGDTITLQYAAGHLVLLTDSMAITTEGAREA